jgi:hypothetical protein
LHAGIDLWSCSPAIRFLGDLLLRTAHSATLREFLVEEAKTLGILVISTNGLRNGTMHSRVKLM